MADVAERRTTLAARGLAGETVCAALAAALAAALPPGRRPSIV